MLFRIENIIRQNSVKEKINTDNMLPIVNFENSNINIFPSDYFEGYKTIKEFYIKQLNIWLKNYRKENFEIKNIKQFPDLSSIVCLLIKELTNNNLNSYLEDLTLTKYHVDKPKELEIIEYEAIKINIDDISIIIKIIEESYQYSANLIKIGNFEMSLDNCDKVLMILHTDNSCHMESTYIIPIKYIETCFRFEKMLKEIIYCKKNHKYESHKLINYLKSNIIDHNFDIKDHMFKNKIKNIIHNCINEKFDYNNIIESNIDMNYVINDFEKSMDIFNKKIEHLILDF